MTLQEWEIELDDSGWEQDSLRGVPQLTAYVLDLKRGLEQTDYMVIKCYEAQLSNTEMPYDLQKLLTLRNTWRSKITQIEFEISMIQQ